MMNEHAWNLISFVELFEFACVEWFILVVPSCPLSLLWFIIIGAKLGADQGRTSHVAVPSQFNSSHIQHAEAQSTIGTSMMNRTVERCMMMYMNQIWTRVELIRIDQVVLLISMWSLRVVSLSMMWFVYMVWLDHGHAGVVKEVHHTPLKDANTAHSVASKDVSPITGTRTVAPGAMAQHEKDNRIKM